MVTFNAYASLSDCNTGTSSKFTDTESIGPGSPSASVTSAAFTPTAPGTYFWSAAYIPSGAINGPPALSRCGDANELLVVSGIPKITAFGFTNAPTNNDPTLGSGTVVYTFTIHNYGASTVTLGGSLTVSGTASPVCTGGNTLLLSGSLAATADATFSLTCMYSGTSGQTVSAMIDATFAVGTNPSHEVSGSPTTYIFTVQTS
jgi:archaellum component FlaG (FlaF/FlaG flagellin family)